MNVVLQYKRGIILAAICIITFFCFKSSLNNQFTNWDDDVYVTNDPYIKALTWDNIKTIFTEDITKNNYHPLCMLSLAVNYHFSGMNPQGFYLTNILIHLANVILVFFLFSMLCGRLKIGEEGTYFIASFGALWFGVHPMHVESVSWIAERKDVLYSFFYLAGLITYIRYSEEQKSKWLLFTFLLFIASCLSKPMAVVFPLSLVCVDFLLLGNFSKKAILQKIPFFFISLICGGFAVYTQNKTGAIAPFSVLTFSERMMYASYGFVMYIFKLFVPTSLSTFYPYPYRFTDGSLPFIYYAAPLLAVALLAVPLIATYKKNRKYFKIILFGYGFFVANIIFVLQFISCGAAIMADRYSYVAYVGLLFMIAWFANELLKQIPSAKGAIMGLLLAWTGGLAYLCYERVPVWHNSETLLKDAINQYPMRALLSYKWLGNYYMDKGETSKALENYEVLTRLRQADAKVYDQVGDIYTEMGKDSSAIDAFNNSLRIQNNVYKTYLDRAVTFSCMGDSANSIKDFVIATQLNPETQKVAAEIGFSKVQSKEYRTALGLYDVLITVNPNNPYYYFYRGVAFYNTNGLHNAAADWTISYRSGIKDLAPNSANNLAVVMDSIGNDSAAVRYAKAARDMGYPVEQSYYNKLLLKAEFKKGN